MTDTFSPAASANLADAEMKLLFPSPVMFYIWPDSEALNQRLRELVFEKREKTTGVVKTNRGGWQSDTDLQTWDDPAIATLVDRIQTLAGEYVKRQFNLQDTDKDYSKGWEIHAWANVNEKGHFNRTHDHLGPHSFFAGFYCVDNGDIGDDPTCKGQTIFEDWTHVAVHTAHNPDLKQRDIHMPPACGRMILFPGSQMHSVAAYQGNRPRITIAFNLAHPDFGIPRYEEYPGQLSWMWRNFRGLMILQRKIPEKLYALTLLPQFLFARKVPNPGSVRSWLEHLSIAASHATALASERFELKYKYRG